MNKPFFRFPNQLDRITFVCGMLLSICVTSGAYAQQGCFLGEIRYIAAGRGAPQNWATANGALINISPETEPLFAILGTQYGGDGRNTFGLPDLTASAPISTGASPGGEIIVRGRRYGKDSVPPLGAPPQHTHAGSASVTINAAALSNNNLSDPSNTILGSNGVTTVYQDALDPSATITMTSIISGNATLASTGTGSEGAPLSNAQPSLAITPIICTSGAFPTQ